MGTCVNHLPQYRYSSLRSHQCLTYPILNPCGKGTIIPSSPIYITLQPVTAHPTSGCAEYSLTREDNEARQALPF
jgi:hypothetical protein